ncbi:MAG: sulfatase [Acidobacteria bacterium]|nr:sulfatase [Acidobacteriota bacterium]
MNRRDFLRSSSLPALAAAQQPQGQRPGGKPNVIWFFGDQHRAQALGINGDPNARTPNLDNLQSMGVQFSNAVSGFPLCCPFRGSLLTGRYPHHCVVGHQYPLPDGQPTIAQPLKDAGYRTAYFGKWHLGGWQESQGRAAMFITDPKKRGGFDTWVGYENNNSQYDCWVHGGAGKDAFHYRLPGYETDALTDLLIKYVKEQAAAQRAGKGQPFFAACSVQPPHDPYVAPPEYRQRWSAGNIQFRPNVPNIAAIRGQAAREMAGYYPMVENLDFNLGRVLTTLHDEGLFFNTHLLFFSDHGDMLGSQGQFRKMTPYEESIRIPFFIAGGQPNYDGRLTGRTAALLNAADIAPTTLGLCGVGKPEWMEGRDLSGFRIRKGENSPLPDSAYLQTVVPTGHGNSTNKAYRGIVTRDGWKYACFDGVSWLMFDLNEDPYEQVNVAHNNVYRAERKKLIARLRQWVADTGDRFNIPDD